MLLWWSAWWSVARRAQPVQALTGGLRRIAPPRPHPVRGRVHASLEVFWDARLVGRVESIAVTATLDASVDVQIQAKAIGQTTDLAGVAHLTAGLDDWRVQVGGLAQRASTKRREVSSDEAELLAFYAGLTMRK